MYLNQSLVQLQNTFKNLQEKVQGGLLIQSWITLLVFQSIILLAGSSCIKLPKKLDQSKKGLMNLQNTDDDKCFKWCLDRYLNPADHNP